MPASSMILAIQSVGIMLHLEHTDIVSVCMSTYASHSVSVLYESELLTTGHLSSFTLAVFMAGWFSTINTPPKAQKINNTIMSSSVGLKGRFPEVSSATISVYCSEWLEYLNL